MSLNDLSQHRLLRRLASIRTTAIIGFFERRRGAVYNSAMVVEGGRIKGVYAKAYPIEDGCAFGKDFPVWSCAEWTFGINICNDLNYPEAAEQIISKGANLICCPLNIMLRPKKAEKWREPALENLRACARRTKRWVASADVTGQNHDGWLSYGCTAIIRPDGTIAARAAELVEDVVLFDLC